MTHVETVKNKIKELQTVLNTESDGHWGGISQEVLEKGISDKSLKLYFDFNKFKELFKKKSLDQSFVNGVNGLFEAFNKFPLLDSSNPLYVSYMLATTFHETNQTFLPLREYGRGKGKPYGSKIDIDRNPYTGLNHIYYGRGYVQLTWLSNYKKMGNLLDVDLVNNPDKAMEAPIAAEILVIGSLRGLFTGRSLSKYIKYGLDIREFEQARRVINGIDKASQIADYAVKFLECVTVEKLGVTPSETNVCPCCGSLIA